MDTKEVAERLHWVSSYVALIEQDEYLSLRSPAFARGYVKAYGRLLAVDEEALMLAFDALAASSSGAGGRRWLDGRDQERQRNGMGMAIGLATLCLLALALWWLRGNQAEATPPPSSSLDVMAPGIEKTTVDNTPAGPVSVGR
jgi:cytoskeleton protein RodZ